MGLVDARFYDVVTHQEAHRRGGAALLKDATPPDPDLTELSTSVVDADGPAVLFETQHPYALGFTLIHNDGIVRSLELHEADPFDRLGRRAPLGGRNSDAIRHVAAVQSQVRRPHVRPTRPQRPASPTSTQVVR